MEIRDFEMSDLPQLVAVQNAAVPMRAYTQNELENDFIKLEEKLRPVYVVALEDGKIVGAANFHRFAGAYHPHKFGAEVFVHPQAQQRGVGTALYAALLEKLAPLEPISLSAYVRESEPHAVAFAEKRGFVEIKRDFESLCNLQDFSSQPYLGLLSNLEQAGVRLVSWADVDSLERRQEFYEVFEIVRQDVPRAEPPTRLSFEFFNENVISDPELLWEACFYALEQDKIVGFTGAYKGAHEGWVDQWLTAVTRQVRGRNIATALKVRQLMAAQKLGFGTVRTDNDTRNAAMLAVNQKLGFVRQPAALVMKKSFEEKQ
jgi:mycothiol synthase